ncbi:hypothetical protein [Delftia acidovorans]|uniref:hypothetical protein n=1 Tax=Delftia acidovorans TaxID=80866 RepID=UPI003D118C68
MTRISDKPLAFQALQQRRRERDEASQAAEHIRLLKASGNQTINNRVPAWVGTSDPYAWHRIGGKPAY